MLIEIPFWLFVALIVVSSFSVLRFMLIPSIRWYFRRNIRNLIGHLNDSLDIKLQPFKLTKRQSLIDSLTCDRQVLESATQWGEKDNLGLEETRMLVRQYAKEIVPSFNAYFYFKVGHWLARRFSQMLYRVRLGFIDEEKINQIDPETPVVFVINHRSNM